jgi:hypothetical protein
MRPFVLTALLLTLCVATVRAQEPETPVDTVIRGGDLGGAIRLTAVDNDAFKRRVDLPPLFEEEPEVTGPSYTVTSGYWDDAVRNGNQDEDRVADAANYYPDQGLVKTRQGDSNVWLGLNHQQRAIFDRYIRLRASLSDAPASLEVLRAAASNGELVGIRIGRFELTPEQRQRFWEQAASLRNRPGIVPTNGDAPADANATWVVFELPEGRTVQMRYAPASNILTEALGGEAYMVPSNWLVPVLGPQAAPGPEYALSPAPVPQQESTGSYFWWAVMLGGGLVCLGLAVLVQRHWVGRVPEAR